MSLHPLKESDDPRRCNCYAAFSSLSNAGSSIRASRAAMSCGISRQPLIRRKCFLASSRPVTTQRIAIDPLRQRLTLRATSFSVPFRFSIGLVTTRFAKTSQQAGEIADMIGV